MEAVRGPTDGALCTMCPFANDGKPNHPVVGFGPRDPEWIVVGESPGSQETRYGAPFLGPNGELLNRALKEVRVDRQRVYATNASLCQPPSGATDDARSAAVAACRPRLNLELARMPGRPLLVLGSHAVRELCPTKLTKMSDLAGTYHESDVDGTGVRVLIPSLHPSFLLRSSGGGGADKQKAKAAGGGHTAAMGYVNLKFDILKVKAVAAGRNIKLDMTRGVTRDWEVEDAPRANQLIQDLALEVTQDEFCAIDLETYVDDPERHSALQMFAAKIKFFGLSSRSRAVSVVWDLLTAKTINVLRALVSSQQITKTYHNMIYEHGVLQNAFYRFTIAGPQEDSMLAHHACFPGNAHRLQAVVGQFMGVPPWKSEHRDGDETPEEDGDYNCADAYTTAKVIKPLHVWIQKTKTERVYAIDRQMAATAAQMHLTGYPIDRDVNAELCQRLSTVIDASYVELNSTFETNRDKVLDRLAFERAKSRRKKDPEEFTERIKIRLAEEQKQIAKGRWEFSPGKDFHMVALLKGLGVPLFQQTATGRTSTSAGILEDLAHIPEVASLLRYRANKTLFSTFVERMFQWVTKSDKTQHAPYVQDDGRVHPIWSVNKISGRWGSENPQSQSWSRGDERNKDAGRRLPNIRRQAVAAPGKRIVGFDLAQLEARTMALQSDDPFLCKVFAEGRDIHGEFALMLFPNFASLAKDSVEYTQQRDITKRLEYGGMYGGSDETVWKSIVVDFPEITLAMVSAAIVKMKRVIVGVLRWQMRLFAQVSQPPYVLTDYVLGRIRVFPMGNPPPTDVANNPNQFAGSGIMNLGLSRMLPKLAKYKGKVKIFSQVHDAGYFEVPDNDRIALQVAQDIKASWTQTFETPSGIPIDFPVDIKQGYAMHDHDPKLDEQTGWAGTGRTGLVKFKV